MSAMETEFDLGILADDPDNAAGENDLFGDLPEELAQWATEQLSKPAATTGFVSFDIETEPNSLPEIEPFMPEFVAPLHPGEFNPGSVKCGNLGAEKAAAKVAAARDAHAAAVRDYDADVAAAKAEHVAKFMDRAALSPLTAHVVAIGYQSVQPAPVILGSNVVGEVTEKPMLRDFWKLVGEWLAAKTTIVGHNILLFDLPFIVRRSWKLGVELPSDLFAGRYFNPLFKDTMQIWACGGRDFVGLDPLAKFFCVGAKTENVNGKDFGKLWAENRKLAIEYLSNDVAITAKVAKALGVR